MGAAGLRVGYGISSSVALAVEAVRTEIDAMNGGEAALGTLGVNAQYTFRPRASRLVPYAYAGVTATWLSLFRR